MPWDVTHTVFTSVFGCAILVLLVYGIHAHLLPHLRRPRERPDITIPHAERPASRRLRESLYTQLSINFIDPRNSIADTELMSSRWSTSLHDLDPPPSPVPFTSSRSPSLPRSPCMHFERVARKVVKPSTVKEEISTMDQVPRSQTEQIVLGEVKSAKTPSTFQRTQPNRDVIADITVYEHQKYQRIRSKSDSDLVARQGLLAQSHAAFFDRTLLEPTDSPTVSHFSGSTLRSPPRTPAQQILRGTNASTSRICSPRRQDLTNTVRES